MYPGQDEREEVCNSVTSHLIAHETSACVYQFCQVRRYEKAMFVKQLMQALKGVCVKLIDIESYRRFSVPLLIPGL